MDVTNVLFVLCLALCMQHAPAQEVQTNKGKVRGTTLSVLGRSVDVFYAIPYAKPPTGDLRFKHPSASDAWIPDVKDATSPGPSCFQPKVVSNPSYRQVPDDFNEDCLHLTVWKPYGNVQNLTVMVWIYGGGFMFGSINVPANQGAYLAAEQNVVVVAINYRLGPLGFAYLGPDTIPGNMGLLDQNMGLQWIKDNILQFGGDPNKVTIFGESAGSVSVGHQVLSPLSNGLFNKAILQSGTPIASFGFRPPEKARYVMEQFAKLLQCPGLTDNIILECLQATPAQLLVDVQLALLAQSLAVTPVIDGYFITDNPKTVLEAGKFQKRDVLIGYTKDEGTSFLAPILPILLNRTDIPQTVELPDALFQIVTSSSIVSGLPLPEALQMFYRSQLNPEEGPTQLDIINRLSTDFDFVCPAIRFATEFSKTSSVFLYEFDHRGSNIQLPAWSGASHTAEIEFVFGYVLAATQGFSPAEKALARRLMTYWANFAKSGNPNSPTPALPDWPAFDSVSMAYQNLDLVPDLLTKHKPRRHGCAFINNILPMMDKTAAPSTVLPNPCFPSSAGHKITNIFSLTCMTLLHACLLLK